MITVGQPPEQMTFQLGLRRRGISDRLVLRAMEDIPRDRFVEPNDRAHAWRDTALAIACGQTISQPFVVAYMTEQLQLNAGHRVLEVGTGSGYQAAILSKLVRDVLSIERYRTLADAARTRLEALGLHNIEVPVALTDRLEEGGILLAPVGPHNGVQTLVRIRKTGDGLERKELVDVRFVPALPGIAREL